MIGNRLLIGRVYGDPTIRPIPDLLTEIQEEQLDLVGWIYPLWMRTKKLAEVAKKLDSGENKA